MGRGQGDVSSGLRLTVFYRQESLCRNTKTQRMEGEGDSEELLAPQS